VVVTGGPGAGKTALLKLMRWQLCEHVAVPPEAASVLYGGGFPRLPEDPARRATQRAIFHVQRELERMTVELSRAALILCDRGTFDGLAYWPGAPEEFWRDVGSDPASEMARYAAVIQLRTPAAERGYQTNHLRTETPAQAAVIDARLYELWHGHPHHHVIESSDDFMAKLSRGVETVREYVPACCRAPTVPLGGRT
jgi:predicted ATPase